MLSSRKGKLEQGMNLNIEYYIKKKQVNSIAYSFLLKCSFKNRLFTTLS